ncbi:MAG: NAD(P)-binding protein, partial [Firmicutes bacterium]|nr:NAD(P)-binding protein [Bacillota bacterium]
MFDTIIVGGGITGLQLGALLSHDGEKVLILDRGSRTGGRAVVQKRKGFIVDYGVHLI